jgi:hypothetical protein
LLTSTQGDSGSAETQNTTEYRQKLDRHISPVTTEIILFTVQEVLQILKELLHNYRLLLFLDDDDDNKAIRESANAAWAELSTFFRDKDSFSVEFLSDLSQGAEERILRQLRPWLYEIQWPENACLLVESVEILA